MTTEYVSASEHPELANAVAASVLSATAAPPDIASQPDGRVELPGGLLTADGEIVREAEVQELTGEHEERIAKAFASDMGTVVSTLLQCGVVRVGDQPASAVLLRKLLLGDREALVLAIRRMTFGDTVDLDNVSCPYCGETDDLLVTLDDIPVRRLEDPKTRVYDVPLKRGVARVRLATGADQEQVFANAKLSAPERNSLLLSRTVISLPTASGEQEPVTGTADVARLGMADRRTLLRFLDDEQPGPRYDELKRVHEACGKESPLAVSVWDLFRG